MRWAPALLFVIVVLVLTGFYVATHEVMALAMIAAVCGLAIFGKVWQRWQ